MAGGEERVRWGRRIPKWRKSGNPQAMLRVVKSKAVGMLQPQGCVGFRLQHGARLI
jgi:hypothetical protein